MSANLILRAIGDHIHAILSPLGFQAGKADLEKVRAGDNSSCWIG